VTNIRARDVIHEVLVYRFDPWITNHDPPWVGSDYPNPPDPHTAFDRELYTINSANGTVTAGSQAQPNILLDVSNCSHARASTMYAHMD